MRTASPRAATQARPADSLPRRCLAACVLWLLSCQPAPAALAPEPVPVPARVPGLAPAQGALAQLCGGARPVAPPGLVLSREPDLGSAEDGAPPGTPERATLLGADAVAALDEALRPDGPFCNGSAPRRKSACGRWQRDVTAKQSRSGWFCLVRRGCGEWGRDAELCVGFIEGEWYPRFLSERPGAELVGRRAEAMKRRVADARREAARVASRPRR